MCAKFAKVGWHLCLVHHYHICCHPIYWNVIIFKSLPCLYCYYCCLPLSNNDHVVTPCVNLYHHWWNVALFMVTTIGQFYQTLTTTLLLQALRFITTIPILDALFWSWTLMTPQANIVVNDICSNATKILWWELVSYM